MNTPALGITGIPKAPKGVTGWLLVFCLTLTLIAPFTQARIALMGLRNLSEAPVRHPAAMVRLASVGAIYIGLAISSFWAGLWLWLEDPRGLALAKMYLLVSPVIVIGLDVILTAVGLKLDLPRILYARLVYSAVWYPYLRLSRRVANTYSSSP